jgi:hypothetical protein
MKVEKSEFGKFNLKNDVILDAQKMICNRNLKRIRRYWAFLAILAHSAILALEVFELKIVKYRRFFRQIRGYRAGNIAPPVALFWHFKGEFFPSENICVIRDENK